MSEFNPTMQLAYDYLESTNTVVFLTGKAGTGKTTFLQQIRKQLPKKLAVVAPTGVAAINAGGMTIHSLFQLPFGPLVPGGIEQPELHYNVEKKGLLASLELLIVDEISMVRPDVLDHIDLILRNIKGSAYPFGGVQLLLIGDLSQLSPVIREEEWSILRPYYTTPYFFSSLVLQKTPYVRIELEHVYRQKEQAFVDILNEVRNQQVSAENLSLLNARYIPDFRPTTVDNYITLTTHNGIAQKINQELLEALAGQEYEFSATISGEFPKDAYPTDTGLKLKIGSQVMFVKNDGSAEKRYYNGKIGKVTNIAGSTVFVQCGEDDHEIVVEAVEWTNVKYELEGEAIAETKAGSFAQVPLKLAWAITIHKSQGLSFDQAIIDVSEAFTHGQAYVALSRCRSLSGMVLRNPIMAANIIGDPAVARFNEQAKALQPDQSRLNHDRERYQLFLLTELFNLSELKTLLQSFEGLLPDLQKEVTEVAEKFVRQLKSERSQQAASYFLEKLRLAIEDLYRQLPELIGTSKDIAAKADRLMVWLMNRVRLMEAFSIQPFSTNTYLTLVQSSLKTHERSFLIALSAPVNEKLFLQFIEWREKRAVMEKVMPNMVLTEKTLKVIAERLPATLKALGSMKGVGTQKATLYGAELIGMIRTFQQVQSGTGMEQGQLF
ncbi:AAA family ATPase [Mucilaginibacter robiniae]|uniref:AAA family ATPase n=1 Tax=Mucilaginibacter robiniae TaxID=2728022 RepID=A0A7L5E2R4_9SPHI|nr:HRDC domain-containing protein [Mucilaginibacter robiniae]QJD97660.1 AAA family ATPase [Mucilaginibacter robiniae]